ncbi:hypothetical protein B0T13DRAFT_501927 [Neurospora crassa]|nr:hypothetical protein B0T13DRAFT_501927 [Neurospora crassa]
MHIDSDKRNLADAVSRPPAYGQGLQIPSNNPPTPRAPSNGVFIFWCGRKRERPAVYVGTGTNSTLGIKPKFNGYDKGPILSVRCKKWTQNTHKALVLETPWQRTEDQCEANFPYKELLWHNQPLYEAATDYESDISDEEITESLIEQARTCTFDDATAILWPFRRRCSGHFAIGSDRGPDGSDGLNWSRGGRGTVDDDERTLALGGSAAITSGLGDGGRRGMID